MATITFNKKQTPAVNEPYYWSDVKLNIPYNIINSYEKMFEGTSKHFFLIQESANSSAPLIEVPLDNNFTYQNYNPGRSLNDNVQFSSSSALNS